MATEGSTLQKLGKVPKFGRVANIVGVLGVLLLTTKRPSNDNELLNEDHDEIDELIEDLDNLTEFCIGFLLTERRWRI